MMGGRGLPATGRPARKETAMAVREETGGRTLTIWLWVAIAVAALAVGWIVYDLVSTPSVPAGVEAAIDEFTAAREEQDADAFRAAVTDDFLAESYVYSVTETGVLFHAVTSEDADRYIDQRFDYKVEVQRSGDPLLVGDGPTWHVSFEETWVFADEYVDDAPIRVVAAYTLVEQPSGDLRVEHAFWTGFDDYDYLGD
jgi:hypothetical protein